VVIYVFFTLITCPVFGVQLSLPVLNTKEGDHMGLIAQEVEKLFPEVVIDVAQPIEDENGEVNEKSEMFRFRWKMNFEELT